MINFFHKLNIDLYPIQNFDIKKVQFPHSQIPLEYLNPEFKNWLSQINLYVSFMELYYKKVLTHKLSIHIDSEPGDYVKLNYIIGGKNSSMNWYKIKDNIDVSKQLTKTSGNTTCTTVEEHQSDLIYSKYLQGLNLVQVGVAHDVYNPEEVRYCICCLIRDKKNKHRITMSEAEQRFNKFI